MFPFVGKLGQVLQAAIRKNKMLGIQWKYKLTNTKDSIVMPKSYKV